MKYNKNIQMSFVEGKTKLKMWNRSYKLTGGENVFNLITSLLSYCTIDRSIEEIKERYNMVPWKLMESIIKLLFDNNVLSNDVLDDYYKENLPEKLIAYLERNYKNINEIANKLLSLNIDIYAHENEFTKLKNVFDGIGISKVNNLNELSLNRKDLGELAIVDCSGLSDFELKEKLTFMHRLYKQIFIFFTVKDKVIGAVIKQNEGFLNILKLYKDKSLEKLTNENSYKILYSLFSKLVIDGFICNSDLTNIIEVDKDIFVNRYVMPYEDVSDFNIKYEVIPNDNKNRDLQEDVNELYSFQKNKMSIIDYLGYFKGNQTPLITIETRLKDFGNAEKFIYCSSEENFAVASVKSISNAFEVYLSKYLSEEDEFVVSEYGYENYKSSIKVKTVFNILNKKKEISYIDVDQILKNKFSYLSPLASINKLNFECYGNDEYKVYEIRIKKENTILNKRLGEDIYEIAKDLLLDYIGANLKEDEIGVDIQDCIKDFNYKNACNDSIELINKKRDLLVKESGVEIVQEGWSYNKYFSKFNIYVAKIILK